MRILTIEEFIDFTHRTGQFVDLEGIKKRCLDHKAITKLREPGCRGFEASYFLALNDVRNPIGHTHFSIDLLARTVAGFNHQQSCWHIEGKLVTIEFLGVTAYDNCQEYANHVEVKSLAWNYLMELSKN